MKKILITGAGSVQSNGVINSLIMGGGNEEIVGTGSDPTDLVLCKATRKYQIPYCTAPNYQQALMAVLKKEKPDMIHFQHDLELFHAMKFREEIEKTGARLFAPDNQVIDTCVFKHKSWLKFKEAGIKVPENIIVEHPHDLKRAFSELADDDGKIWLRSTTIGAGGKGAFPSDNFEAANEWIEKNKGWGEFSAAEMLTPNSITWLSIWHEGKLVVAQTRRRKAWAGSSRSISGVTGVTKIGEICSFDEVDAIAQKAIFAITDKPHGIFGVDMTYDKSGVPNPTEINISRFFATILFFTTAGLNMPVILKDICLYNRFPKLEKKINPLQNGLMWLRGMDSYPKLITEEEIQADIIRLPEA